MPQSACSNSPAFWLPPDDLPSQWRFHQDVADTRLDGWDSGGDGPPVVMLHPVTGTADVFAFQLHALAAAGYRVIAYSRRGHGGSTNPSSEPGIATRDFIGLMDALGIANVTVLAAGGGGGTAIDVARQCPERVSALILACSLCGMSEPGSKGGAGAMLPPGFRALPITFKELGPAFRWAYPEGVARWEAASCQSVPAHPLPAEDISPATLAALNMPVLMVSGDADLYVPPPRLRALAGHVPEAEAHVVSECGHSVHWECPQVFNALILDFLGRALGQSVQGGADGY